MKFSLTSLPGRLLALALCFCLVFSLAPALQAAAQPFSDVPADSFAYEDILFLREQGITQGIGNNEYGTYLTFKRCDFVLMLGRLMGWDLSQTPKASDVPQDHYAAGAVAAAEAHGLIESAGSYSFRPDDAITREEMAVMLVRALGISSQAEGSLAALSLDNPFLDLSPDQNPDTFYGVRIAYDLGIIQGQTTETPTTFDPKGTATREQTAAMMMRFYRVSQTDLSELHGFYAISSYSQKDKISSLTSMTTGWSRMEYGETGPWLNTTSAGNNDWAVPAGSQEIVDLAKESQVSLLLGVYLDLSQTYDGNTRASLILSEENREAAVQAIVDFLRENPSYQGVTIDFEGFVSESYKAPFTAFLTLLRQELNENGSYLLYCALPPMENYRGYDWRAIGDIVDKVILMAHDYDPNTLPDYLQTDIPQTPLAPFNKVYQALLQITDEQTGVRDKSKVLLAISFGTTRWEYTDTTFSSTAKTSSYEAIRNRLQSGSSEYYFDESSQSPYLYYYDDSDGTYNVVWYENADSVQMKCTLAQAFGIGGVSLWRLGLVPDEDGLHLNVWESIENEF